MKTFFLTSKPVSRFMIGVAGFFFRFFDYPIWVVIFKINSIEVFHFSSQDFMSGANTCYEPQSLNHQSPHHSSLFSRYGNGLTLLVEY